MPMPPSNSTQCHQLRHENIKARECKVAGSDLTSFEGVLEGEGIIDFEALLSATGKAALVLVEPDVEDLLLIGHHLSQID